MVMRRFWSAFSRYRPRVPTVLVVAAIGALLVLANLSDEFSGRVSPRPTPGKLELRFDVRQTPRDEVIGMDDLWNLSYGWPLRWRQYVLAFGYGQMAAGPFSSMARLAADVAIWLFMLGVPAAACEWLLRHYRPRFRWSLRTMLAAVALVAVCCAWFVHARRRANVEDAIAAAIQGQNGRVWFDRWGPTWLELVGADHLFRQIVGADFGRSLRREDSEQLLTRLARLPKLKFLFLKAAVLTPTMAEALSEMHELQRLNLGVGATPELADALTHALLDKRGLKALSIDVYDRTNPHRGDEQTHRFLAAISKLTQLEELHLADMAIAGESFAMLANLTNLNLVSLDRVSIGDESELDSPLAATLSALRGLEVIALRRESIGDRDLRQIGHLPNLKSLIVTDTTATSAGLAAFRSLESLEVLAVSDKLLSAAMLEPLRAAKRLRELHIWQIMGPCIPGVPLKRGQLPNVPAPERDGCVRALEDLRRLHPGLVIDHYTGAIEWAEQHITLQAYDVRHMASVARAMVRDRQEKQAQQQTATGGK